MAQEFYLCIYIHSFFVVFSLFLNAKDARKLLPPMFLNMGIFSKTSSIFSQSYQNVLFWSQKNTMKNAKKDSNEPFVIFLLSSSINVINFTYSIIKYSATKNNTEEYPSIISYRVFQNIWQLFYKLTNILSHPVRNKK